MVHLTKRRKTVNENKLNDYSECEKYKEKLIECLQTNKMIKEKNLICKTLQDAVNDCKKYTEKPRINII